MSEFTETIAYNGQNATALATSLRSRIADGGRVTLPTYKLIPDFSYDEKALFWSKVNKTDDCWLWTGARGHKLGYGSFRRLRPHRIAWVLSNGQIPDGRVLDHLCRNPRCVRPDHLEVVTMRENTLRGVGPSACHARKTHCPKGHPLPAPNARNERPCQQCKREQSRRSKGSRAPMSFSEAGRRGAAASALVRRVEPKLCSCGAVISDGARQCRQCYIKAKHARARATNSRWARKNR